MAETPYLPAKVGRTQVSLNFAVLIIQALELFVTII